MNIRSPDYQQFSLTANGIENVGPRISKKLRAISLPPLHGLDVMDVGCDYGFWSFHAALNGARRVVGIDRNRDVKGVGMVDLVETNRSAVRDFQKLSACEFYEQNVGKQWMRHGTFDVIYLFSLYHHIYNNTGGDHSSIWFWLWQQLEPSGVLIWENPLTSEDAVVKRNVESRFHEDYNESNIIFHASRYFDIEYQGPALHEDTREVLRLYPTTSAKENFIGTVVSGAGGASKAFSYADDRRSKEIEKTLGFKPYPGSLNVKLDRQFDWTKGYYRSQILDVADRSKGLSSEWVNRWARFYPISIEGVDAYVFRFEGERYPNNFLELIAPERLRDKIDEHVTLWR